MPSNDPEAPCAQPAGVGEVLDTVVPFYGPRQAGITTPAQRHSCLVSFDVTVESRRDLGVIMRTWTGVAAQLCAGEQVTVATPAGKRTTPDSGEAVDLGAARLTVNFGFGPRLFGVGGPDRFGLLDRWPMQLVEVPSLPGDDIAPGCLGADLTVHACADDPQVVVHAIRELTRSAGNAVRWRWSQSGFNEAAASNGTPRNLLGFKDGTVNPTSPSQLADFVWASGDQGQDWMIGGTYLVVRRIRIDLAAWDRTPVEDQERVIGRYKRSGAPLGSTEEHDTLDLDARDARGGLVIPLDAHVRLAASQENWGQMMLRRSYSYDNGVIEGGGVLDAGLLFMAYQQDPRIGCVPVIEKLARRDALNPFIKHTASAVVAIPPGAREPGEWVGESVLG